MWDPLAKSSGVDFARWLHHTAIALMLAIVDGTTLDIGVEKMPIWINYALVVCLVLSLMLVFMDYGRRRSWQHLVAYLAGLLCATVALYLTTGFPVPETRQAFGVSASPLVAVVLMFVGVIVGIAATYVFNLTGAFSWRDFARPLVVSPLVLLPLIGSLQGAALEPVQLVCFVVLAFQNGFFWQQVLRDAKPTT